MKNSWLVTSLLLLTITKFSTCKLLRFQLGNYKDKNLLLVSGFFCLFCFLTDSSHVGYPIGVILSHKANDF